ALIVFAGVCIAAGYVMAAAGLPPWARGGRGVGGVARAFLGAPAGWTALLVLAPAVGRLGGTGVLAARDRTSTVGDRVAGWATVASAVIALAAGALLLLRLLSD